MLASIAEGVSHISGFLQGEDSLNTIQAFRQMGVPIARDGDRVRVDGVGLHGLGAPAGDLEMGNSGTAMRLSSSSVGIRSLVCTVASISVASGSTPGPQSISGTLIISP